MNVRTAKLPLHSHINLKSCTVLTVVHVFEILLKFRETNSWAEAINAVIPQRKRTAEEAAAAEEEAAAETQ